MLFRSLLLAPLVGTISLASAQLPIRVVSFNIRYDASSREDNESPWWTIFCPLEHSWCRMYHLCSQLGNHVKEADTAIIGLQEVLSNQLTDILTNLGPTWASLGVARDDGARAGEFTPILYDTTTLTPLWSETKWLSPTPDTPSFGWGAGSRRIITLALFEHRASGTRFLHANTHLDNVSEQARVEGVKVVAARIAAAQAAHGPGLAVTLTGDFNSSPGGGDAYGALAAMGTMTDLWMTAERVGAEELTYSGFTDTGISRIDFIWYGLTADALYTPNRVEVVNNKVEGTFISDHRMVYGDLTLA